MYLWSMISIVKKMVFIKCMIERRKEDNLIRTKLCNCKSIGTVIAQCTRFGGCSSNNDNFNTTLGGFQSIAPYFPICFCLVPFFLFCLACILFSLQSWSLSWNQSKLILNISQSFVINLMKVSRVFNIG